MHRLYSEITMDCSRFRLITFLFCVAIARMSAVADDYRTVETKSGQVRGIKKLTLLKQVEYHSFQGIPYAKPPIGELRFKAPEPVEPWAPKILDAFEHGATCIHPNLWFIDNYPQNENCLFLNVYVPAQTNNANANDKLAVMFYIHGGAFFLGSGNENLFGPDFLIDQNVIVVTSNYRLGAFGFLSFDNAEHSGNMGLKDQQMALKWIHENIGQFNGDNKRITTFGSSAGAVSTHFHVLSSESQNYINNAILLSGTVDCTWALSPKKSHVSWAYQTAADWGHPQKSLDSLIEFFKRVPSSNCTYCGLEEYSQMPTLNFLFAPVIETQDAKAAFMTQPSIDNYKTTNVKSDILFLHSSLEYIFFAYTVPNPSKYSINSNFSIKLPLRNFNLSFESEEYRQLATEIRRFYFRDATIDETLETEFLHLLSDMNFVYPNYRSMKTHQEKSKGGRTFYSQFSVDSTLNANKKLWVDLDLQAIPSPVPGATHFDETCYIFRCNVAQKYYDQILQNADSAESRIQLQTIEYITKMLSNFAKYGEPTYKDDLIAGYGAIQGDEIIALDISNDGLKVIPDPRKSANEFWAGLERMTKA